MQTSPPSSEAADKFQADYVIKDASGAPLRLYHGGLSWVVPDFDQAGRGALWLTPDVTVAVGYADQYTKSEPREIKVFMVSIQKPLDLRQREVVEKVFGEDAPDCTDIARCRALVEHAVQYAKLHGHDGIIHPDSDVYNRVVFEPSYVVFNANQLKLTTLSGDENQWNLYDIPLKSAPTLSKSTDYPAIFADNRALAAYIEELSPDGTDREFVEEYFHGAGAVLRLIPVEEIAPGDQVTNIASQSKQDAYWSMPADTYPPIIVENGIINDGHHRFRNVLRRGDTHCWCYDVIDAEFVPKQDAKHPVSRFG